MLRPFRQVDVFTDVAVPRQPGRRRARRRRADDRGDAALRPLDEPVRDDVRAAAEHARGRLPGPHLHAGRRAALRRPPDARAPATPGSAPAARRRGPTIDRAGVRGRARHGPPRRGRSGLRRAAAAALGPGRGGACVDARRRRCWASAATTIVDAAVGRQRSGLGGRAARQRRGGARPAARRRRPRHRRRRPCTRPGAPAAIEVRAFFPKDGATRGPGDRQPQRLAGRVAARAPAGSSAPYVARQGTALGRAGRVHVTPGRRTGTIWVGGGTVTCVTGEVDL